VVNAVSVSLFCQKRDTFEAFMYL